MCQITLASESRNRYVINKTISSILKEWRSIRKFCFGCFVVCYSVIFGESKICRILFLARNRVDEYHFEIKIEWARVIKTYILYDNEHTFNAVVRFNCAVLHIHSYVCIKVYLLRSDVDQLRQTNLSVGNQLVYSCKKDISSINGTEEKWM